MCPPPEDAASSTSGVPAVRRPRSHSVPPPSVPVQLSTSGSQAHASPLPYIVPAVDLCVAHAVRSTTAALGSQVHAAVSNGGSLTQARYIRETSPLPSLGDARRPRLWPNSTSHLYARSAPA